MLVCIIVGLFRIYYKMQTLLLGYVCRRRITIVEIVNCQENYTFNQFYNIVTTLIFGVFLCFGQIYVVRVLREGQVEPTFVFRTFDEFQELHNKLGILFPLWKLPGYVPNSLITIVTEAKKLFTSGWKKK